jgi:mannitol-1-phosphate 5-dehydrogenase
MARVVNKKIWLLFGAGGIGRGLLAPIAQDAGYKIIFAEPDQKKIEFFLKNPYYQVFFFDSYSNQKKVKQIKVSNAINSTSKRALSSICSSPDLKFISTSVRVDNLEAVAKVLAPALAKRKDTDKLIILVCENVEKGGDKFKELLEKEVKGVTKNLVIPNISVDCMIPPHPAESLTIKREKFGELKIEKPKDKNAVFYLEKLPNVKLIKGSIDKLYQKKIIGVSGLHAGIAWLGFSKGHKYVHEAASDPELKKTIDQLIKELTEAIVAVTGFSKKEVETYLKEARARVSNKNLPDSNERFFRNLRNKLNKEERFLKPALIIWKKGRLAEALLSIVSIGIKKLMKEENLKDVAQVIKEVCQLPKNAHPLEEKVIELVS